MKKFLKVLSISFILILFASYVPAFSCECEAFKIENKTECTPLIKLNDDSSKTFEEILKSFEDKNVDEIKKDVISHLEKMIEELNKEIKEFKEDHEMEKLEMSERKVRRFQKIIDKIQEIEDKEELREFLHKKLIHNKKGHKSSNKHN